MRQRVVGQHLDLVGLPRERRLRTLEVRRPAGDHRRLAAQRLAVAGEEDRLRRQQGGERGPIAIGHAAREGALGRQHLGLPAWRSGVGGAAQGHAQQDGRRTPVTCRAPAPAPEPARRQ
jgi:hypothetical protein